MRRQVRIGDAEVTARVDFCGDVATIEILPDTDGLGFIAAAGPGRTVRVIFGDERDHDFVIFGVDRVDYVITAAL